MSLSSRTVIGWTFAFLLVGFLALLGIVAMNLWLGERTQFYFTQAIEARDTRGAAVELRNAVQTAESSQRGFLVGGNEIYLAPYDLARTQAQRQMSALSGLLAPYADFAATVDRLQTIVADKFAEMDQTIALLRQGQNPQALELFRSNQGKALMDELNVFISGITRQADDRLISGVEEQRANAALLRLISAIGALVIVAVVGGASYLLLRYTRELQQTQSELDTLNAGLEGRVAERTADLAQSRDRAEVLLSEVNHRVANSLALVSSLVSLQSKAVKDEAARHALAETQDRIFAISLIHKRLYGSQDARAVTLDEYLSSLLDHLKTSLKSEGQGTLLSYDLEPVELGTDASVNLGVVVTEWVTNAFKYAYPDGTGEVRVKLRQSPQKQIELLVEDDGVGRAEGAPARGTGLGSRIVAAMGASLKAEITYEPRQPGTRARLAFTPAVRAAAAE